MILVVDDERDPTRNMFGNNPVTVARTSAAAREAIDMFGDQICEIWFDHDLGGEDTTRGLAYELAEDAFNGNGLDALMVVHTANVVGRDWLASTLGRFFDVRVVDAVSAGLVKP